MTYHMSIIAALYWHCHLFTDELIISLCYSSFQFNPLPTAYYILDHILSYSWPYFVAYIKLQIEYILPTAHTARGFFSTASAMIVHIKRCLMIVDRCPYPYQYGSYPYPCINRRHF